MNSEILESMGQEYRWLVTLSDGWLDTAIGVFSLHVFHCVGGDVHHVCSCPGDRKGYLLCGAYWSGLCGY
jgi:hypothetical protein